MSNNLKPLSDKSKGIDGFQVEVLLKNPTKTLKFKCVTDLSLGEEYYDEDADDDDIEDEDREITFGKELSIFDYEGRNQWNNIDTSRIVSITMKPVKDRKFV